MHESPPIVAVHGEGFRGEVVAGSELERWIRRGGKPHPPTDEDAKMLKRERGVCTALIHRLERDAGDLTVPLFVKQHQRRDTLRFAYAIIGRHRAKRAWRMSLAMLAAGVPVPRPYGYVLQRLRPFSIRGFFYCEGLDGVMHLRQVVNGEHFGEDRRELLRSIAGSVAAMHEHGLAHGDLKWTNILVSSKADAFWLVDLDGMRRTRSRTALHGDVARFVVGAKEAGLNDADINVFLDPYAAATGISIGELRGRLAPMIDKYRKRHQRIAG